MKLKPPKPPQPRRRRSKYQSLYRRAGPKYRPPNKPISRRQKKEQRAMRKIMKSYSYAKEKIGDISVSSQTLQEVDAKMKENGVSEQVRVWIFTLLFSYHKERAKPIYEGAKICFSNLTTYPNIPEQLLLVANGIKTINTLPLATVNSFSPGFCASICADTVFIGIANPKTTLTSGMFATSKIRHVHFVAFQSGKIMDIGRYVLSFCTQLETVSFDNSLTCRKVDNGFCVGCNVLNTVCIDMREITSIGDSFCANSASLSTICNPGTSRDFRVCKVNLPKLKSIGTHFLYATNVRTVVFDNAALLCSVGQDFCNNCENLVYFDISSAKQLKRIGKHFLSDSNLHDFKVSAATKEHLEEDHESWLPKLEECKTGIISKMSPVEYSAKHSVIRKLSLDIRRESERWKASPDVPYELKDLYTLGEMKRTEVNSFRRKLIVTQPIYALENWFSSAPIQGVLVDSNVRYGVSSKNFYIEHSQPHSHATMDVQEVAKQLIVCHQNSRVRGVIIVIHLRKRSICAVYRRNQESNELCVMDPNFIYSDGMIMKFKMVKNALSDQIGGTCSFKVVTGCTSTLSTTTLQFNHQLYHGWCILMAYLYVHGRLHQLLQSPLPIRHLLSFMWTVSMNTQSIHYRTTVMVPSSYVSDAAVRLSDVAVRLSPKEVIKLQIPRDALLPRDILHVLHQIQITLFHINQKLFFP